MINKARLFGIIESIKRGEQPLTGDLQLLVEAVELLDDLATTIDRLMVGESSRLLLRDYRPETTQELKITKIAHYRPETTE